MVSLFIKIRRGTANLVLYKFKKYTLNTHQLFSNFHVSFCLACKSSIPVFELWNKELSDQLLQNMDQILVGTTVRLHVCVYMYIFATSVYKIMLFCNFSPISFYTWLGSVNVSILFVVQCQIELQKALRNQPNIKWWHNNLFKHLHFFCDNSDTEYLMFIEDGKPKIFP